MKILIYGINYTPELTGIGKYTGEMAEWLTKNGHNVSVITAMPYYPEWETHKSYKRKLWHKEIINGIKIFRCPIYVPKKVNSKKRILHEFSFLISSSFRWIATLFKPRYDLVICINPPFHIGILPYLYSKFKKIILVTHIQDLQIDAAKDLNMLGDGSVIRSMLRMEHFLLKNSNFVSTLTEGMKRRVSDKNIRVEKIVMLPNWVDIENVKVLPKEQSLREQFNIPLNDIVFLYSGNIGKKQGLDILLDVAETYKGRKDIHFIIVGTGVELENLKTIAKTKELLNVWFFPLQPYRLLPALLATADFHLVLQKKGASDLVMPSKLTGILASGGCPIVSAEKGTSLYSVISDNKIGLICEPESEVALAEIIDFALKTDIENIKLRARAYAEEHLGQDNIMKVFMKQIGF